MHMLIKKTFSKENRNKDKVTSFMIDIAEQFKSELERSTSTKETMIKLQEFIMVLQSLLSGDRD